ncbi:hypothetical protein OAS39_00940 [Pirellulales bacterium]|nr:hypothetical protein [Pirellulales bacterium]
MTIASIPAVDDRMMIQPNRQCGWCQSMFLAVITLALAVSIAQAGTYEAVNRIDSDPLVESVAGTGNFLAGEFGNQWWQVATLVRQLPVGGTAKEARFLVAGVGGISSPDVSQTFLLISDFERFDFSLHLWTDGDEAPGNAFFVTPRNAVVKLDLPTPGMPGFLFDRMVGTTPLETIPNASPLWEVTVDLTPYNIALEEGQEFAFSLSAVRTAVDGFLGQRALAYPGPHDLQGFDNLSLSGGATVDHLDSDDGNSFNQLATAFTLDIAGPDIVPVATTRAIYTGVSGGQWDLASNWDKGVAPQDNGTKFNVAIPDDIGTVNFTPTADAEITHLSIGRGNTLNISGGNQVTVAGQAVVPGNVNISGAGTVVSLEGPGTSVEQLGRINVTGGAEATVAINKYSFPRLARSAHSGGPGITTNVSPFRVDGIGSKLDLSTLKDIGGILGVGGLTGRSSQLTFEASEGGMLDLSGLEVISTSDQTPFNAVSTVTIDASAGGVLNLDSVHTLEMTSTHHQGIIIKYGVGDAMLPSLTEANAVTIEKHTTGTVTVGPTASETLTFTQSRVIASDGAVISAPRLTDFTFGNLRLTDALSMFDAPMIDAIDGSRYILRDGAQFVLPANPTNLPEGTFSYNASFQATHNGFQEEPFKFISAGADTLLDLQQIEQISVSLGSVEGLLGKVRRDGEISAIDGGEIDLSELSSLSVSSPGGGVMSVNVDSGGRLKLATSGGDANFFVDGAASTLEAASFHLPETESAFPSGSPPARGKSLLITDRGRLEVQQSLSFANDLGDVASGTLQRMRNEIDADVSGVSYVTGGVDLNRGVVHFVGSVPGTLEVAGGEFLGFDGEGRPIIPVGRAEFGMAQLVVGEPTEAKVVELVNLVDNSFDDATNRESLYLWGFDEGLPDFAGGPLGDGLGASLVIHPGSTLLIPESIDVVYFDTTANGFVHINSLFDEGVTQIDFDGGSIGLLPSPPGDFDGNGFVDSNDLAVWEAGFGTAYDGTDFLEWQRNTETSAPLSGNASLVPEPGSLLLSLVVLCCYYCANVERSRPGT